MDLQILQFIQHYIVSDFLDPCMQFFSYVGEAGIIWIIIGISMAISKKYRVYGFMLLLAMLLGFLVGEIGIKNIVQRVRPCYEYPIANMNIEKPESFSFPSGHSCSSFAAAFILLKANKRFGVYGFVLAPLIAFSRLYNYVHYPTDVLAGIALGLGSALLIYSIFKKFVLNKERKLENEKE